VGLIFTCHLYRWPDIVHAKMGLPEELYSAMVEVGYAARRHKIPGPLANVLIDTAHKSLDLWRQDEQAAMRFAAKVLAGPTNIREMTGQLPEPVASACWRLIRLLEYLALDGSKAVYYLL
jgi:hypothetical protein